LRYGKIRKKKRRALVAKVITRVWKSTGQSGHQVKRLAYGYRIVVNGKPEKVTRAEWTKDDAQDALAVQALEEARARRSSRTRSPRR
jgi:hypothetical protein